MIDMAMPMKLAVILFRSANTTQGGWGGGGLFNQGPLTQLILQIIYLYLKASGGDVAGLTERVPLVLPYCLRQIDWQISGQRR